jgi:hypothetical protein
MFVPVGLRRLVSAPGARLAPEGATPHGGEPGPVLVASWDLRPVPGFFAQALWGEKSRQRNMDRRACAWGACRGGGGLVLLTRRARRGRRRGATGCLGGDVVGKYPERL